MEKQPDLLPARVTHSMKRFTRWRQPWLWLGVALLAVLAILMVQQRIELSGIRSELTERATEGREIGSIARIDHQALQTLQAKVEALETSLTEAQNQADAFDAMYREIAGARDERLLAEVEQALALAVQQLQLSANVEAALMALQAMDARLATSAQPRFLPLRRLISRDIAQLKALPIADLSGLTLKIDSVVAAIDTLPLAFERRPGRETSAKLVAPTAPMIPEAGLLVRLGQELWRELRSLVRIERMDPGAPALLAPQQSYFLRENLRLHLLGARLALLMHDKPSYRASLRQAHDLLERYFDGRAKPVQAALATTQMLATIDPSVPLPALSETLNAARALKLPREKKQ
jgi:uroporphyrin-3 C-methyltransferase